MRIFLYLTQFYKQDLNFQRNRALSQGLKPRLETFYKFKKVYFSKFSKKISKIILYLSLQKNVCGSVESCFPDFSINMEFIMECPNLEYGVYHGVLKPRIWSLSWSVQTQNMKFIMECPNLEYGVYHGVSKPRIWSLSWCV